jgi:hypothetical protein
MNILNVPGGLRGEERIDAPGRRPIAAKLPGITNTRCISRAQLCVVGKSIERTKV